MSQDKQIAWSHTVLNSFETCARRHYLTKVSKEVADPPSENMAEGRRVHTALQLRLENRSPLPPDLAWTEKMCVLLTRQQGEIIVEKKLAISASFQPSKWSRDPSTWCRCIIDIGVIGARKAVVADWKTGRRKPDNDQLELFAGVTFAHYPHLEEVTTAFLWLQDKKIDVELFTRGQVGAIWSKFLPRVKKLELAHQENVWRPTPSGLCGEWCPVTRKHCEHGRT
jgi:hypothetical protein